MDGTCLEQCPEHVQDIEIFLGHCPIPALPPTITTIMTTPLSSAAVAVEAQARIIMTTPPLSAVVAVAIIIMSKLFVEL